MEEYAETGALIVPLISREKRHRRAGAHAPRAARLHGRGDGDDRLHLPVRRDRHRQRRALRGHQGHAPQQPQGPQLGAQRQGLLHARPRRACGRLHGPARQGAGLAGGPAPPRRRGRLPARHRQDRRAGPGAAQAERPQRARVGAHAAAPHLQRRDHPSALRRRARGRRAPPPRALERRRVPGRTRGRGHPAHRPRHVRGGLLRRHVVPPSLPAGTDGGRVPRGARALRRRPVRPGHGRRVPARARGHRGGPPDRGRHRRPCGGGPGRRRVHHAPGVPGRAASRTRLGDAQAARGLRGVRVRAVRHSVRTRQPQDHRPRRLRARVLGLTAPR